MPEPEYVYRSDTAQGMEWTNAYGLHREDGPAVQRVDGSQEYWRNGVRLAPEAEQAARLDTAAANLGNVRIDPADLAELRRIAESDQRIESQGAAPDERNNLTDEQRRQLDAAQQYEADHQADQGRSDHL